MNANQSTHQKISAAIPGSQTGTPAPDVTEELRTYIMGLGVDDVGFARASDYQSPRSRDIAEILPGAQSVIVLAYKVLSNCESPALAVALNGYLDLGAFARGATYRAARFLESRFDAKIATLPISIPFEIRSDKKAVADFSQRHAAVAAGLGNFGRHNLVIHPRFGTRIFFSSIVTDLPIPPSVKPAEDLCIGCNLCVENCPGGALDEEGKTDIMKCLKHSQPYGNMANGQFWAQLLESSPEKQKEMLQSEQYGRLQQAHTLGSYYQCFNCIKSCPIGV